MPRGGARPGAGRKKKDRGAEPATLPSGWLRADSARAQIQVDAGAGGGQGQIDPGSLPTRDPLEFMLDVMQGRVQATSAQMQAAVAVAPYVHPKKGETGKKAAANEAAKGTAGKGRFAAAAPPRLVHSR